MTTHIDDTRLHAYLDGELDRAGRATVEAHAADCPSCARRLAAFAEVRTALDALPRAGSPPADLWPAIVARLEIGADVVPLPVTRSAASAASGRAGSDAEAAGLGLDGGSAVPVDPPAMPSEAAAPVPAEIAPARRRRAVPLAYAAGLVLAFAAGAVTWQGVGPAEPAAPAAAALPVPDEPPATGRLAAATTYEEAILDLETLLDQGRSRLDPATVRTVEESLEAIDRAIAEAEEALASDPESELLRDMLLGQQRAKYRVLSRATSALLPRT